jgi:hypothetical protein
MQIFGNERISFKMRVEWDPYAHIPEDKIWLTDLTDPAKLNKSIKSGVGVVYRAYLVSRYNLYLTNYPIIEVTSTTIS